MKDGGKTARQLTVRFGRNHHVVLAIGGPPLLIVPFIFVLRYVGPWPEWLLWTVISMFSITIMRAGVWLALRMYPQATITMQGVQRQVVFETKGFPGPEDFTFSLSDIRSVRRKAILGIPYHVFTLRSGRVFQLSPVVAGSEDLHELFDEEMKVLLKDENEARDTGKSGDLKN